VKARQKAGIERQITAHSFRHGFGTRALQKNINPRYVQTMLGHARLDTTMIYMQTNNKEVEEVYRAMMG
jgi:site-specific recombinase XerD